MVFANKYTQNILETFPEYTESIYFKELAEIYPGSEIIGIHIVFSGFSGFVAYEVLNTPASAQVAKQIFDFIEACLNKFEGYPEGTDENSFDNAACVSFLENLINYASWGNIEYSTFIPLLGPKSRAFCKGWDDFTCVRSPGLWTDEEWEEKIKTDESRK